MLTKESNQKYVTPVSSLWVPVLNQKNPKEGWIHELLSGLVVMCGCRFRSRIMYIHSLCYYSSTNFLKPSIHLSIHTSIKSIHPSIKWNQSIKLTPHQTVSHYMPLPRSCWIALGNRNSAISVWPKFVNRLPCSISASCDFLQESPCWPPRKRQGSRNPGFFFEGFAPEHLAMFNGTSYKMEDMRFMNLDCTVCF